MQTVYYYYLGCMQGDSCLVQGCILNLKFIFLPPPLLDLYFFPNRNLLIMRGCAPQVKSFKPFLSILYILSQQGKKYTFFLPIEGGEQHFPPFFYPLSIIFPPQPVIWPYFCPPPPGRGQTEKYTPLDSRVTRSVRYHDTDLGDEKK